jgi:hypothetical protein
MGTRSAGGAVDAHFMRDPISAVRDNGQRCANPERVNRAMRGAPLPRPRGARALVGRPPAGTHPAQAGERHSVGFGVDCAWESPVYLQFERSGAESLLITANRQDASAVRAVKQPTCDGFRDGYVALPPYIDPH